jgi:hypothetical protein
VDYLCIVNILKSFGYCCFDIAFWSLQDILFIVIRFLIILCSCGNWIILATPVQCLHVQRTITNGYCNYSNYGYYVIDNDRYTGNIHCMSQWLAYITMIQEWNTPVVTFLFRQLPCRTLVIYVFVSLLCLCSQVYTSLPFGTGHRHVRRVDMWDSNNLKDEELTKI